MTWKQTSTSLALIEGSRVVWQLNFDPREGKPYFHPVTNPAGDVLTALRPADHPWHRGIWWSWKFINGLNYWEENEKGVSEGQTTLHGTRVETQEDFSARISQDIDYHPPHCAAVVTEHRQIEISGNIISWCSEFTAVSDVTMDRTPVAGEPDGMDWGGYAGLSVRLAEGVTGLCDSEGRTEAGLIHGQSAAWVELAGIRVTPEIPSRWYAWTNGMQYFSPAILFGGPIELGAGQRLNLNYEIFLP